METMTESFQEVGTEGATVTLIIMEAEEVLSSVAINECEPNELKGLTPDEAMTKVENEVEEYLERINTILKDKKRTIADAKENVFYL